MKAGTRLFANHWINGNADFDDPDYARARSTWFYRWVRVAPDSTETEIGSNSAYYKVTRADRGSEIRVEVSFIDLRGNPETVVSNPVSMAGTAQQGTTTDEPLKASLSVPESHDGEKAFTIELEFSEDVFTGNEGFDRGAKVREALVVTNARATDARRIGSGYRK